MLARTSLLKFLCRDTKRHLLEPHAWTAPATAARPTRCCFETPGGRHPSPRRRSCRGRTREAGRGAAPV